jgi:hypothetical protein
MRLAALLSANLIPFAALAQPIDPIDALNQALGELRQGLPSTRVRLESPDAGCAPGPLICIGSPAGPIASSGDASVAAAA